MTESLGTVLDRLAVTIASRREAAAAESYTARLLAEGPGRCARKFGEEAVETMVAALAETPEALAEEAADALYHLLVLLAVKEVAPEQVADVLRKRQGAGSVKPEDGAD